MGKSTIKLSLTALGDCILYVPFAICILTQECFMCTIQKCNETNDCIEQYIADNEFNCFSLTKGTPADLNSRIKKVYEPERTRNTSIRNEIKDIIK